MRVKKYLARSLPEAVAQVKAELGAEAIILHTRPVRRGGLLGLFAQRFIEVTAAADVTAGQPLGEPLAAPRAAPVPSAASVAPFPPAAPAAGLDDLQREVQRLSGLVSQVVDRLETPGAAEVGPAVRTLYAALVQRGVDPDLAVHLAREVEARLPPEGGPPGVRAEIARQVVQRQLGAPQTLDPARSRVAALVGPTGVGKTTTLAKLAAFWALRQRAAVALITADTYRIAAVEQLRTYCEIIGVPLTVVDRPAEVAQAIRRHREADLVLVDTAGRSHRNPGQMAELAEYLAALQPCETYLVLSLTASSRDALAAAAAYGAVGFDRLLFTKLDEAVAPGVLLNVAARCQKPLSYVTTGQNVPDDIQVARPDWLSRVLLGDGA